MHCVTACILGMVQWVQWVCCYLQSCRHDWLPFVAVLSYHAPCWFWGGKDTSLSGLPIWAGEYKALLAESWYERDSAGFDGTLTLNLSILWRECKSISEIGLVDGCIVVCFYASLLLCCVTAVQPWQMARHGTNRYQRARWTISRRTLHVSGCWRCEKSGPRSSWDHPFNPPWICSQQHPTAIFFQCTWEDFSRVSSWLGESNSCDGDGAPLQGLVDVHLMESVGWSFSLDVGCVDLITQNNDQKVFRPLQDLLGTSEMISEIVRVQLTIR